VWNGPYTTRGRRIARPQQITLVGKLSFRQPKEPPEQRMGSKILVKLCMGSLSNTFDCLLYAFNATVVEGHCMHGARGKDTNHIDPTPIKQSTTKVGAVVLLPPAISTNHHHTITLLIVALSKGKKQDQRSHV
jgi:hypothetical protein